MSNNKKKHRDWGSIKLYSITGFICVGIISMAALSNHNEGRWVNSVNKFNYESRNHVMESPKYKELSPVGGDHFGTWQNCGFYSKPIENGNGVHSLEHGAVWLTYNTNLSDDELNKLKEYAQLSPYVLVSPLSNINNKLTLSAWNRQLILDNVNDDRVLKFIKMFASGPQTPEPGAPCWGGLGEPEYGAAG